MKKYRVRANNGFKSEALSLVDAVRFADQLRVLGNYGVELVRA